MSAGECVDSRRTEDTHLRHSDTLLQGSSAMATLGKIKILVVEDDPVSYNAMRLLLEHYEFEVALARTVSDAVKALADMPSYVLLDLMLPDGDDMLVLKYIRKSSLPIKVAMITVASDATRM